MVPTAVSRVDDDWNQHATEYANADSDDDAVFNTRVHGQSIKRWYINKLQPCVICLQCIWLALHTDCMCTRMIFMRYQIRHLYTHHYQNVSGDNLSPWATMGHMATVFGLL